MVTKVRRSESNHFEGRDFTILSQISPRDVEKMKHLVTQYFPLRNWAKVQLIILKDIRR